MSTASALDMCNFCKCQNAHMCTGWNASGYVQMNFDRDVSLMMRSFSACNAVQSCTLQFGWWHRLSPWSVVTYMYVVGSAAKACTVHLQPLSNYSLSRFRYNGPSINAGHQSW
eukprot:scpid108112/ scgid17770/ 